MSHRAAGSHRATGSQRATGRRLLQLAAAGLLAGSGAMLWLPASHAVAATGAPSVVQASWFWQTAYEQANPPVAPPTTPPSEPSGVPTGDLAVAYTGAQDSAGDKQPAKMTALAFDTTVLTPGTSIQSFTFSLTLDTQAAATSFAQQDAMIVACLPTRGWPATAPGGGDFNDEPTFDCASAVKPEVKGNVYTFAVPAIAQTWVDDQNLGVAIVPDPKNTNAPFQLVFTGPKTIKASISYEPGVSVSHEPPPPSPPAGGGGGGVTNPQPVTGGNPNPVPVGVGGITSPAPVPPPVVAPSAQPSTSPVAAIRPASSAPSAGFWVAAAILGVFMLIVSLVLGDPSPPVTAGGRSKLDHVLRERGSDAFTVRRG